MNQNVFANRSPGPRHSILDLAPLELECMSALWPLGEGTVRDIHRQIATSRPRAYTTIMTIMDRLAHKGIVTRRRVGRAYRYQANLSANEARVSAVEKIVTGFFDGSPEALAAHLAAARGASRSSAPAPTQIVAPRNETPLAANQVLSEPASPPDLPARAPVDTADTSDEQSVTRQRDKTLL
ncbi:MAG: transcriptional repressor, CopY family [Candidatus Acidoferrum typicum]|nr:transcriptional repressor, CopY family [Candidatus Acidoferrum typicum]